jgi:hypothetical protein
MSILSISFCAGFNHSGYNGIIPAVERKTSWALIFFLAATPRMR